MSNLSSSSSSNSQGVDIAKSNVPLHVKFAIICLNKIVIPKWFGTFCFALSHIQALALIIKSAYLALPDNTPSSSPAILVFVKLFAMGDWCNYANTSPLMIGTLIITLYNVKVLSLIIYTHCCLALKRNLPDLVQSYWNGFHTLHPLLIFFWIHTFCVEILRYSQQEDFNGQLEVFMTVMALINTVINCGLAIFFSRISVIYKTKDAISSKTNILETKSLIFKIVIPFLWIPAKDHSGIQLLTLVLILVNTLLHDWLLFDNLPYYRIKILLLSAVLQGSQTSLAFISFIIKLLEDSKTKTTFGVFSVQVIWLVALPIITKVYYLFIWRVLKYIFGCEVKKEKNLTYLVHKRFILLYYLKSRKVIHAGVNKFSYADIMYQARLADVVAQDSEVTFLDLDANKMQLARSLKVICLEILGRYPTAILAQTNLAYSYSQFEDLYLVSNNLLENAISRGPGYHAQISLNMIRFELQKKLKLQFSQKTEGEGLNVHSYIMNQELHEQIKAQIEKQTEMQLSFWKEFLASNSDMLNLLNIALGVNRQREVVKKLWHDLVAIRPLPFLSPLVIYGMYSSLINNDSITGEKYIEQSQEDGNRMSRFLKAGELNNQTIFSDKSFQVTMSGLRSKLGKIMDCSANITNFYGWQGRDMKGRPIASLMPPFYRQRHDGFLLDHFNTGRIKILNKTMQIPVKKANGYIHPSWVHVKVSPVMDNGIFYVALLLPCKSNQRMVLVRKDGTIDDMSFEFAKDMHLMGIEDEIESDIFDLCPEFVKINEAFNMIADKVINANNHYEIASSLSPNQKDILLMNSQSNSIETTLHNMIPFSSNRKSVLHEGDSTRISERPLLSGGGNKRFSKIPIDHLKGTVEEEEEIPRENEKKASYFPQAQAVYDSFTNGSILKFYPKKVYGGEKPQAVLYHVRVANNIHGRDLVKYVLLERVSGGDEGGTEDNFHVAQLSDQGGDQEQERIPSFKTIIRRNDKKKSTIRDFTRIHTHTSPSLWETEGAELMEAISPKQHAKLQEPVVNQSNDDTKLSIGDERQNDDSMIRKTVTRNIIKENNNLLSSTTTLQRAFQNNRLSHHLHDLRKSTILENSSFRGKTQTLMSETNAEHNVQSHVVKAAKDSESQKEEDGHIMTKPQRFKQKFEEVVGDVGHVESSVTSYSSKGKKVQELVIKALRTRPYKKSSLIFSALFIVFFIFMLILLAVQDVNLNFGVKNVKSEMPVISAGFLRQYYMISSATQVRAWKGVLDGDFTTGDWTSDNNKWKTNLESDVNEMDKYNTQFYQLLAKLSADIQSNFYEKNVRIYEYNEDGSKTFVSKDATFEAYQWTTEKELGCLAVEIPTSSGTIDTSSFKFVIDNVLNDLLIESQDQTLQFASNLNDSTNSTTTKIALTMVAAFVACLIFMIISIRFLYLIGSQARIFMMTIFRIKLQDCEAVQVVLQQFLSCLNTDNMKNQDLVVKEEKAKKEDDPNDNNISRKFRRASMGSLYKSQRIVFLKLLPIYLLFICWSLVYYFLASNFVKDTLDIKNRMEAALQALNNQALFMNELASISLSNATAKIKNKPLVSDFEQSMQNLEKISRFVNTFKDRNGDLNDLQENVLYDFQCEEFLPYLKESYDDYIKAYQSCLNIEERQDTIGLLNINSKLYSVGLYILNLYEESSKTQGELGNLFLIGLGMSSDLAETGGGILRLLYQAANDDFDDKVDSISDTTVVFTILVVFVTLIVALMTWHFAMKKIFKTQKIDWEILQIIPIRLILSNKHLQQYLLKHSDGILDGIKRFL